MAPLFPATGTHGHSPTGIATTAAQPANYDTTEALTGADFVAGDGIGLYGLIRDPGRPEHFVTITPRQWQALERVGLVNQITYPNQGRLCPLELRYATENMTEAERVELEKHNARVREEHKAKKKEFNNDAAKRSRERCMELINNLLEVRVELLKEIQSLKHRVFELEAALSLQPQPSF